MRRTVGVPVENTENSRSTRSKVGVRGVQSEYAEYTEYSWRTRRTGGVQSEYAEFNRSTVDLVHKRTRVVDPSASATAPL